MLCKLGPGFELVFANLIKIRTLWIEKEKTPEFFKDGSVGFHVTVEIPRRKKNTIIILFKIQGDDAVQHIGSQMALRIQCEKHAVVDFRVFPFAALEVEITHLEICQGC